MSPLNLSSACYHRNMKNLYVKQSGIAGKGIHAKTQIPKGKRIAYIQGVERKFKSGSKTESLKIPTWYGISKTKWIDPKGTIFQYMNHSCKPNAAIIGTKTVIALRNIKPNEEITIDYSMTDADELWELFPCQCNMKNCRKHIRSIQHLAPSIVRTHLPFIPKYFVDLYKRSHSSATL